MDTFLKERKLALDSILQRNQTDIVGNGYIDIIAGRSKYINQINELVLEGFNISSITWWEWCNGDQKPKYGMGGPKSKFYDGWYAELPIDADDLKYQNQISVVDRLKIIEHILTFIHTKQITLADGLISFQSALWLTPALWLDVPTGWENIQA
jgi:hypothetical protein